MFVGCLGVPGSLVMYGQVNSCITGIFFYASAGFLPAIIVLELWYAVYELLITLKAGKLIKVFSSSWWTGTQGFSEEFNTYCTESSENIKCWTEDERCLSWGMESAWPSASAAPSCRCKLSPTAVGYMTCLRRTWFTIEIKEFLIATSLIVWTSKLFRSSFYLWQFSLGGVHSSFWCFILV